jgi:hypothetical protein
LCTAALKNGLNGTVASETAATITLRDAAGFGKWYYRRGNGRLAGVFEGRVKHNKLLFFLYLCGSLRKLYAIF